MKTLNNFKDNAADIQYRLNLLSTFENELKRKQAGSYSRQTENGLHLAIDFLNSIDIDYLTDNQFKHALRLSYYRGNDTDYTQFYTL